jgi:succinate dehydrogenase / fumarate reductase membrane anchor subunit
MPFWGWFLQRITGACLLFLLAAHMYLTHFVTPQDPITLHSVQARMHVSTLLTINYLLLFLALFHGLYGLRIVLMDLAPKTLNAKVVGVVLTIVGICFGVFGAYTLRVLAS